VRPARVWARRTDRRLQECRRRAAGLFPQEQTGSVNPFWNTDQVSVPGRISEGFEVRGILFRYDFHLGFGQVCDRPAARL
jgi:hypothetical protein